MSEEKDTLKIDADQAVEALHQVEHGAKSAEHAHKSFAQIMNDDVTKSFLSAHAAYDFFKEGLHEGLEIIKESIKENLENAQAQMTLDVVLKQAGNTSRALRFELKEQADTMETLTGRADDATLKLDVLAASFGVAPDQIERFTAAAIRMGQVTGSAEGAMRAMAKGSETGKVELAKWGIVINDVDKATGDYRDTLEAIEKKFPEVSATIPEHSKTLNEMAKNYKELRIAAAGALLTVYEGWNKLTGVDYAMEIYRKNHEVAIEEKKKELEELDKLDETHEKKKNVIKISPAFVEAQHKIDEEARKKAEEARKKAYAEEVKEDKAHSEMRSKMYEAAVKKQDDKRKEAAEIIKKDRAADDEETERFREFELHKKEEHEAHITNIEKTNYEARERIYAEAAAQKMAIEADITDFGKQMGQQAVALAAGFLKEQLLNNTAYTRAHHDQIIQQITLGKSKLEADKAVADFENKSAQEAEAAMAEKTAAVLADIAVQAGTKALMYGAEAVGFLVSEEYEKAGNAGIAAGLFAAIALASGGTAAAISSNRGMTSQESSQLAASGKAAKDRTTREAQQTAVAGGSGVGTVVNVFHMGITGQTEVEQGRELERIRTEYEDTKTGK